MDILRVTTSADAKEALTMPKDKAWMQRQSFSPSFLSDDQRVSLSAMITYTSHKSGKSEFRIERQVADHFNMPNLKYLKEDHFDDAIHYLTDLISK